MMDITEIKSAVRSLTRGRARLRHEKLQGLDAETIANVESFLMGLEGVTGAQINPRVGSLLLTWDPAATSAEALLESAGFFLAFLGDDKANANEAPASEKNPAEEKAAAACEAACAAASRYAKTVEGAVARTGGAALDLLAPLVAPDQKKGGRKRRVTQNRLMLLAYLASIGILAAGGKRLHWMIGTGFTALLGVHLYQHRRVL